MMNIGRYAIAAARSLAVLALALPLLLMTGEAQAQKAAPVVISECPAERLCIVIPAFRMATRFDDNKNQIISSAVPRMLQVALLEYPGLHMVSSGDQWRALRAIYTSPKDWQPDNLTRPSVLEAAGAEFVISGSLHERRDQMQLSGTIRELKGDGSWRSQPIRTDPFRERDLMAALQDFASQIVNSLTNEGLLDFEDRLIVATPFCRAEDRSSGVTEYYAEDLPRALTPVANAGRVTRLKVLEKARCVTPQSAAALADRQRADAVLTGMIESDANGGSVTVLARVYLAHSGAMIDIPLGPDTQPGFLQQRNALLRRFGQFLKLALDDRGNWQSALDVPQDAAALLAEARRFADERRFDEAEFLLASAIALDPEFTEARLEYASVLRLQGEIEVAARQLDKVLSVGKAAPEAYALLGDLNMDRGDVDAARKAYETQLEQGGDAVQPYLALGEVAILEGREEKALELFEKARTTDPDNLEVRERLAEAYMEIGRGLYDAKQYSKAYDAFTRAIDAQAEVDGEVYYMRGRSYARAIAADEIEASRGYQPAIADYRKAVDRFESGDGGGFRDILDVRGTYLNLQELYVLEADYDAAIALAKDFLALPEEKASMTARDRLLSEFHIAVSEVLRGDEPDFAALREAAGASEIPYLRWSFHLLERFMRDNSDTITEAQVKAVEEAIAIVKSER